MKILFIGGEKDNFIKLAKWVNNYTDHSAYICEKNTDEIPEQAPISDPDIEIVTQNCAYMERNDELGMGIKSKPIRVLYLLGAPLRNRLGVGYMDWRIKTFTKYFASYTPLDAESYVYWSEYRKDFVRWFDAVLWLPYPDDVTGKDKAVIAPNKEFTVATALSQRAMVGAYSKQTDLLIEAQRELKFKLDIIHSVSRDECWDRIKKAYLYFGNMNRGAVSVSEKEAMSFGIAAMSWIRDEEKQAYEKMGKDFPLINVTPETLKNTIKFYMDNPELCVSKGQECFNWMHNNYTPEKIANYWCDELKKLI